MTRIVFIIALITAMGNLGAQGLEISVYTEPQLAWLTSNENSVRSNGPVLNLNTGFEFDIFFMPNYALTIGVEMNNQGGRMIYSDTVFFQKPDSMIVVPGGIPVKHNLQYIGVPLGLKLKSAELGYTTFYFQGALNPFFNIKAATTSEELAISRENTQQDIHLFNLNYFISVGLEYRLAGNTALMVGLKWSAGFSDITGNDFARNNLNSTGLHLGILF